MFAVRILFIVAVAALAACKGEPPRFIDAGPDATEPTDAAIDAMIPIDAVEAAPGRELTSAGGHVVGTTHVLDVQIGHPVSQAPVSGTAHVVSGNAPVKP